MLSCTTIGSRAGPPCPVPRTEVSNARQISVLALPTTTLPHLILVYENSSQQTTVMHGHADFLGDLAGTPIAWRWNDVTTNLTLLAQDNHGQLSGACSSFLFNTTVAALTCFLGDEESPEAQNTTVNGALTAFFSVTEITTFPMLSCSSATPPTHHCIGMSWRHIIYQ